jgi:predicted nucleic acid-binding protein
VETFLTDSSPLVALLNKNDAYHRWAREQFDHVPCPVWTCEGAIAEASYLLQADGISPWSVIELLEKKILAIQFDLSLNVDRVLSLMKKYADTPMDFVDACLVAMTEEKSNCKLLTLDSDFKIYRRFERQTIPLIAPK